MHNKRKILSFVISLKIYRKNSVILKKAKYKMAADLNIHPNTFTSYLKESISYGYIVDCGYCYKVVKFKDVVVDFYNNTGLAYGQHKILSENTADFKTILSIVERHLIIDNVIEKQRKAIKAKVETKRLISILKRTDKSYVDPSDYKRSRRLLKKAKSMKRVAEIEGNVIVNPTIQTSARHSGGVIGISTQKANTLLNSLPGYKRKILVKWFPLISVEQVEYLRDMYPGSTVYPMISKGKIKVCLGSTFSKVFDSSSSNIHNFSLSNNC